MELDIRTSTITYPVIIGRGLIDTFSSVLGDKVAERKIAVVTDDNVAPLYLARLLSSLPADTVSYIVPHGEKSKNWNTAGELLEWLADVKLCRSDLIVALGGGVVGDLAGFVASVYMRGVDYVQVPTTFLAAIDSSVGGKTAVDLTAGKNLAGRIYPPRAVVFDADTLKTLPASEWKCGMGEAVKYGVLAGGEIFRMLEEGVSRDNITDLVQACVAYKRDIVEADENENGKRRLLNLGHTLGHAIETESALGFPHGVCVAMGIYLIARACVSNGILSAADYKRITALLQKYGFPECPYSVRSVLPHVLHDKKLVNGAINAVVIRGIGDCDIMALSPEKWEEFVL